MPRELSAPMMGSTAHVTVNGGPYALAEIALARLDELQSKWNRFQATSELCRLNSNRGSFLPVSPETYRLIAEAVHGWWRSDGRFDPTVLEVVNATGYDRPFATMNTTTAADTWTGNPIGHAPGCSGIALLAEAHAVFLPSEVTLDLGGIAKGYAADLVLAELLDDGARGACVNIGGDVAVGGEASDDQGWVVEIGPVLRATGTSRHVALRTGAVCTSSTTKRRWKTTAGAMHHLINPASGRPSETDIESVTVLAARAVDAEIATKDAAMLSSDRAADILARQGFSAVIVTVEGEVIDVGPIGNFAA
jgi:FAD:protein FMN transferase